MGMGRDSESENSCHLQRSRETRHPSVSTGSLGRGGEDVKQKLLTLYFSNDESLESEKGLGKTRTEEGKVEQGVTGMSLPRRRGKGEPGRAQGEFHPHWTEGSSGSRVKTLIF